VAEGAPLLREYTAYTRIEGSNPSLSAIIKRPRPVRGFLMIVVRGITDSNPGSNRAEGELDAQLAKPAEQPGAKRRASARRVRSQSLPLRQTRCARIPLAPF
jgi:hypothetical protein